MPIEINDTDEEMDEEETFGQPIILTRQDKKSGKVVKNDTPIENATDIPLFEDADKRGLKSVTYLRLIKLDKPNSGYKGNLPISSTLETISQLYGDGLYNIEACNHRHQVLRSKENIRISMADGPNTSSSGHSSSSTVPSISEVISELSKTHKDEVVRLSSALTRTADESKDQSRQFIELVKGSTEASMQRDREHMASVNKSQQDFFAHMMLAQGQMFQQTMAILTVGHQHLIESLRTTYEGSNKSSDVDTLLKGIVVARSFDNGSDEPDWLKALDKGGNMLSSLLKLKEDSIPSNKNETEKKQNKDKKAPISKQELLEVIRLKQVLNRKGIDFGEMVRQAREAYIDSENNDNEDADNVTDNDNVNTNDESNDEKTK